MPLGVDTGAAPGNTQDNMAISATLLRMSAFGFGMLSLRVVRDNTHAVALWQECDNFNLWFWKATTFQLRTVALNNSIFINASTQLAIEEMRK
jgi:hypothetical protein